MNSRLTPKDRGLIKGAVRRAFARSELRRSILAASKIEHTDVARLRVKTWYECSGCQHPFAQYQLEVDHISPVIPITSSLEEMSWDELINNTWCDKVNLQVLCEECHYIKSAKEREQRKVHKNVKSGKTSERSTSSNRKRAASRAPESGA